MRAVFLHGAGRPGRLTWASQAAVADGGWTFLDRHREGDDPRRDSERILAALRETDGGHVVASSYGGNAAVLAAQTGPAAVRSLTLFEPSCFDLARGLPAVEAHIAAMAPVFAAAGDPAVSAREFSALFAVGMGTPAPELPDDVLEIEVSRLRALPPPWRTGLSPRAGLPVPTLVITGAWSELYDQTAEAMAALGAEHVVLSCHGHRPHDAPGANELMLAHWDAAES